MNELLAGPSSEKTVVFLTERLKAEVVRLATTNKISQGKVIRLALAEQLRHSAVLGKSDRLSLAGP